MIDIKIGQLARVSILQGFSRMSRLIKTAALSSDGDGVSSKLLLCGSDSEPKVGEKAILDSAELGFLEKSAESLRVRVAPDRSEDGLGQIDSFLERDRGYSIAELHLTQGGLNLFVENRCSACGRVAGTHG